MTVEDEIQRRILDCVNEISLRCGSQMTSEIRDEIIESTLAILREYESYEDVPEVVLDPIQPSDGSVKMWVGGLPLPMLVPDEDEP